jgi:transcriptional regulator with XRE-family HTH domain
MTLGKNVSRLRNKKGMSQQALSNTCQIAISTLQKLEYGYNTNPTLDVLSAIAKALDVSLDELVN